MSKLPLLSQVGSLNYNFRWEKEKVNYRSNGNKLSQVKDAIPIVWFSKMYSKYDNGRVT